MGTKWECISSSRGSWWRCPNGHGLSDAQMDEDCSVECQRCSIAAPDPRWRPMRTAPRDGTVVEILTNPSSYGQRVHFATDRDGERWNTIVGGISSEPIAWRPAHGEWNETQ